jgi:transposase
MARKRKHYTDEFKLESVRLLVDSGKPLSTVARELGISGYLLSRWKHDLQDDTSAATVPRNKSVISSRDEEINKLRRELKRVTDERDFLKKTAAYFAKELK